jgi:hypothetical protein
MAQAQCTDGKTDKSDLICCYWDSVNEECVMVTQALLSVDYHRKVLAQIDMAAELKENLPKAEEFGRSKIT